MKILFFNYEFPPLGGGAGNATFFLMQEYAKAADLEIDLITSSVDGDSHLEMMGKRIRIHRLPIGKKCCNLHFQSRKDLIVYSWKAFLLARCLAKKSRYDLTHSFFTVPCGALSLYFRLRRKIPFVVSLRGADVPGYSERFARLYVLIKPLVRMIWRRAAVVVANSQGLKELALMTDPSSKIGVIGNGVDTGTFDAKKSISDGGKKESFTIICVSRLTSRKAIRFLIGAMEILIQRGRKVNLEVIGEGDEKKNLEDLVKEKGLVSQIRFLGRIEHEKLPWHYSRADLYVSPSLNEGMSNTMLEALAMGLPIIATETGGTAELVEEGVNGFVVRKKDAQDLAEKISRLMDDEELQKAMAMESRKKAEKMSWGAVAQQYQKIYRDIASADKR